ncbi:MAG: RDD family protein [Candidatus Eremiobacteraeota bacterium]|nr:RDD family protein [Candidatus Eremiobacteraeota bacterium]
MDRTIAVRTPESIAFDYELAGLGSRFLAVILDMLIQIVCALALVWAMTALALRFPSESARSSLSDRTVESLAIAIVILLAFLIFFGYFIIFEVTWNGQTPGKRLIGIRVVRDGGYPVDFISSLVRNLIRVLEVGLGFYALSAISTLLSAQNKRLGDFAAGTIVVRDTRIAVPLAPIQPRSEVRLNEEERSLANRFLERRSVLALHQRRELAAQIAGVFRGRVGQQLASLDDEALIERIAGLN